jgi:gliding motility-associated protein GldC
MKQARQKPLNFAILKADLHNKMNQSTIKIDVLLDPDKVPQQINWSATDSTAEMMQKAKAMCLAFWDGADKTAMRIDLWTKDMMVDEMADFYYQLLMSMADTFKKATQQEEMSNDMKKFAKEFFDKFRAIQLKEQK